jgi:hypothetical protein
MPEPHEQIEWRDDGRLWIWTPKKGGMFLTRDEALRVARIVKKEAGDEL